MKNKLPSIIFALIFIAGFCVFIYPTISNLYNESKNSKLIDNYTEDVKDIDKNEYDKMLSDARLYNQYLYDEQKRLELGLKYEDVLSINGSSIMGYLEIPKISASLVIFHSTNSSQLQDGIGHVESSSLPIGGESTHCALAGHRGLPSAKLLSNLDYLEKGDVFYIRVLNEVLQYRVDNIAVVEPEDVSKLKVETGKDYVTLITCTPYGINSHRLLVRGVRVQENSSQHINTMLNVSNDIFDINPMYLIPISMLLLLVAAVLINAVRNYIKNKRKTDKKGDDL